MMNVWRTIEMMRCGKNLTPLEHMNDKFYLMGGNKSNIIDEEEFDRKMKNSEFIKKRND